MLIIKEKILEKYSILELKKIFGSWFLYFKRSDFKGELYNITSYLTINNLDYSLEEFKKDYPKLSNNKEIATIFKLYKSGFSLRTWSIKFNKNINHLKKQLKDGYIYNSTSIPKEFLKYVDIAIDTSDFKIELYKKHIELYGEKEKLEAFRRTYSLKERVYFEKYKNSYHLAFKGFLADYISYKEREE